MGEKFENDRGNKISRMTNHKTSQQIKEIVRKQNWTQIIVICEHFVKYLELVC